jgi:hypothetical protein
MYTLYLKRVLLSSLFSMLTLPLLFAATIVVTSTADSGEGSLRAAIADAAPGDEIRFGSKTLRIPITLASEIVIDKDLRIRGNGMGNTIIDGGDNTRAFNISGVVSVYIGILTITNCAASDNGGAIMNMGEILTLDGMEITESSAAGADADMGGGAVFNTGNLQVNRTRFINNSATGASGSGGAIMNFAGGFSITRGIFTGNTASRAGGAIEDRSGSGTSRLTLSTMTGNSTGPAPGNGGGVHITGASNLVVRGGSYTSNTAAREGGALWNGAGIMVITDANISNNTASGPAADDGGGGVFNNGGELRIFAGTTINNNVADGASGSGGGVFNAVGGTLRVVEADISGNTANRAGAGIEDASGTGTAFTVTDATINNNEVFTSPGNGGGIHISGDGSLSVSGGTINGNIAGAEGGGIWNNAGTTVVSGTVIDGNTASGDDADQGGGGLFNNDAGGTMIVNKGTVISNNTATGTSGSGGGILNTAGGTLELDDVVVMKNTANRAGGGIEDASGGETLVVIARTTVDSNEVFNSPGNGGGIHVGGDGNISFRSGMLRGNVAGQEGGGIWIGSGTLTVGQGVLFDGNVGAGDAADQGGGALFSNGNGTMIIKNNVTFNDNHATGASGSGGAILNTTGATLLIDGAVFTNNTANRAGGAIEDVSGDDGGFDGFRINKSVFTGNEVFTSPGNGGAIHISGDGDLLIVNGSFDNNIAGSEGGAVWNNRGTMKIIGATFTGNVASGAGGDNGGGAIFNNGGTMNVLGITATDNQATGASGSGGALLTTGGNMTVISSTFTGNTANRAGGAVEQIDGLFSSTNNTYDGNVVGSAPGNGGAFHVTGRSSTVIINGGSVVNNQAGNEGGGLWNQAGTTMSVNGVTIMNNSVTGTSAGDAGGGIFNNSGITEVSNSTIAGNTVAAPLTFGGGIFNKEGGDFTLTASTVSGNTTGGDGGGISNEGAFDLVNSTVAFNTAFTGGGFSQFSPEATLSITGTIISDNDATTDQFEDFSAAINTMASGGFNLIGDDDQDTFDEAGSDIIGGDAGLDALANNGGVTMTHALDCESDAIDAGNPADDTNDQAGQAPEGTRDIGAFESSEDCEVDGRAANGSNLVLDAPNQLDENVSLFPNPTGEGAVNINIPALIEGEVTMRLIDGNGRVRQERRTNASGIFRFPMNGLPNGTYSMQIINGEQVATRRLVKMN